MYKWSDIKLKTIKSEYGSYLAYVGVGPLLISCSLNKWHRTSWWEIRLYNESYGSKNWIKVIHDTIYPREKGFRDAIAKYLNTNAEDIVRYIFMQDSQDK